MAYSVAVKNAMLDSLSNLIGGTVSVAGGFCIQARGSAGGSGTVVGGSNATYASADIGSKALTTQVTVGVPASTTINSLGIFIKESGEPATSVDVVLIGHKNLAVPLTFDLPNNIIITSATLMLVG